MRNLHRAARLLNMLVVRREELAATLLKNPGDRALANIRRLKWEYAALCRRIARLEGKPK